MPPAAAALPVSMCISPQSLSSASPSPLSVPSNSTFASPSSASSSQMWSPAMSSCSQTLSAPVTVSPSASSTTNTSPTRVSPPSSSSSLPPSVLAELAQLADPPPVTSRAIPVDLTTSYSLQGRSLGKHPRAAPPHPDSDHYTLSVTAVDSALPPRSMFALPAPPQQLAASPTRRRPASSPITVRPSAVFASITSRSSLSRASTSTESSSLRHANAEDQRAEREASKKRQEEINNRLDLLQQQRVLRQHAMQTQSRPSNKTVERPASASGQLSPRSRQLENELMLLRLHTSSSSPSLNTTVSPVMPPMAQQEPTIAERIWSRAGNGNGDSETSRNHFAASESDVKTSEGLSIRLASRLPELQGYAHLLRTDAALGDQLRRRGVVHGLTHVRRAEEQRLLQGASRLRGSVGLASKSPNRRRSKPQSVSLTESDSVTRSPFSESDASMSRTSLAKNVSNVAALHHTNYVRKLHQ